MDREKTHPLQLLEILQEISFYFNKEVLVNCIQVSKLWHQAFLPRIWESVSLDSVDSASKEATAETLSHIKRNAGRIHSLSLFNLKTECTNELLKLDYPKLTALSLKFVNGQDILPAIKDMIIRHGPRLVWLNLRYSVVDPSVFQVFDLLEGCKDHGQLRSLFLGLVIVDISAMDLRSRQLLWSLDELEMDEVEVVRRNRAYWDQLEALGSSTTPAIKLAADSHPSALAPVQEGKDAESVPSKVRDLTVVSSQSGMQADYSHFLACQELRSMTWVDRRFPSRESLPLADDLLKGHWPFLNALCLGMKRLSDRDLADIILALGDRPMVLLELNNTSFGPLAASAWVYGKIIEGGDTSKPMPAEIPRPSLKELYVRNTKCGGVWMHRFLCLYPNLRRFAGTFITDRDVTEDPRPWTCLHLIHLNLDLRREVYDGLEPELLDEDEDETLFVHPPSFFFDRIATLTRLEELLLSQKRFQNDDFHTLELQLTDPAVDALQSLTRLMQVYWRDVEYEDAQYIEEMWPCLDTVITRNISDEADDYLCEHGINTEKPDREELLDPHDAMSSIFDAILGVHNF
ncbi:hypothetical protein EMPS_03845 [Entomortierella parvispora]|uniref:F-box domain-containing protein n=1 Tax=Entomortierella parvispora TaxID=205924 RepID=A0A9P3H7L8_9FUNG|nr:hypothetical protein EMPS_03845 [Entomortierella parvispora]